MPQWVDLSHDFGLPMARFTLKLRDFVMTFKGEIPTNPDDMAERLLHLIVREHPSMAGGSVVAMDTSKCLSRIRIWYVHPNLSRTLSVDAQEIELKGVTPERA